MSINLSFVQVAKSRLSFKCKALITTYVHITFLYCSILKPYLYYTVVQVFVWCILIYLGRNRYLKMGCLRKNTQTLW